MASSTATSDSTSFSSSSPSSSTSPPAAVVAPPPTPVPVFGHSLRRQFLFPEGFVNLNHGSFGAIPTPVMAARQKLQLLSEQYPDNFMRYHSVTMLDNSRADIAALLNVPVAEVVFVTNATTGINTVLRNLQYDDGDVILHFGTIYGACGRTVQYLTDTTKASCVVIPLVYPASDAKIIADFKAAVADIRAAGKKPKVVLFDTVSSMPGMRFPWEKMIVAARENDVLSVIDGAHGVGNIKIDLTEHQPDFFVSNCHKWLYTPRPAAVLHVPTRNQHLITTSIPTSHYYLPRSAQQFFSPMPAGPKSNFVLQFEFNGTIDPSPLLCVPAALDFRRKIGGEDAIRNYCTTLAYDGGERVARILGTEVLKPDGTGADAGRCPMVNIRLPLPPVPKGEVESVYNRLTKELGRRESTFVQVYVHAGKWWVRLSGQVYLQIEDFEWIGGVLLRECARLSEQIQPSVSSSASAVPSGAGGGSCADAAVEQRRVNGVERAVGELSVSEPQGAASVEVSGS
ncbi:hypothetical protein Dda_1209 [Drechslerella dactyloides]|uniref:Aminotransferase class V domain-containing protein n=1 Tax=Drechslerella dactyloides TaxID=74499 RepID=A0AAD6J7D5_DREDA|nr:hypothetical protein Dda_1209 [Drechslerella dactyloides]